MKKNFFSTLLFIISLIFIFSFIHNEDPQRWKDEVRAYEKKDSLTPPPVNGIVFTGSSSIRLWENLTREFPGKKVLNRGIGGALIQDIIYYADPLIFKYKPKKVFLFIGGNDIAAGKNAETVFSDVKTLINKIKTRLPNTKIYYIAVQSAPSRISLQPSMKRANELIKAYISNNTRETFIDVYPLLLDHAGNPKDEFYIEDKLHMNAKGYERWARVIRPYLD